MSWTPADLPDQKGKTYAITGGNSGLGLEAAKILTHAGARVVITSRSDAKAKAAIEVIKEHTEDADVDYVKLDLSKPASVAQAAIELSEATPGLDGFINNAGVMQTPLIRTEEGFELQIATNHLGHFRLNSAMFGHLHRNGSRIVPVASVAHHFPGLDPDDLNYERRTYNATQAYAQSKRANIVYGFELHRRLMERVTQARSIPCHPGYAATNLQSTGVGMEGGSKFFTLTYSITNKIAQTAEEGAYPLVYAAADPAAIPGRYYGPTSPLFFDTRGPVGESAVNKAARSLELGRRLWEKTEELVGPFFR